jgi:hypothetical protein
MPTEITRCAACGRTFDRSPQETVNEAIDRHREGACDGEERRAAFYATPLGQGVRDAASEEWSS